MSSRPPRIAIGLPERHFTNMCGRGSRQLRVKQVKREQTLLFMVIERFRDRDPLPIYRHLRDRGRMMPEGLTYLESWVEPNFDRCFQLMECDDLRLIQQWILNWHGSGVTIEIVPVVPSKDTMEVVGPRLGKGSTS